MNFWETILNNYNGFKIIIWGIGECRNKEINTEMPDDIFKSLTSVVTKIAVRDRLTQRKFDQYGITPRMIGCPSTVIANSWSKNFKKKYLLNVIHTDLIGDSLPHWRKQCENVAENLGLKYVETNHVLPQNKIHKQASLLKLVDYYKKAAIIVSSRLHGLIFGSTRGVPVIPISNDYKIEAYWKGTLKGKVVLTSNDYEKLQDIITNHKYDPPEIISMSAENMAWQNEIFAKDINNLLFSINSLNNK